jgi:hypothetical protein
MVLVGQLTLIRDALRDPAARARASGWFGGRFHGIDEMTVFIQERLTHIHAIWMPYRQDRPQPAGMTEAERGSVYRTVVRVAQRALCELRDEPEVGRLLDSGLAATDVPEIHVACKRIATVLSAEIDVEPGRPTQLKARRVRALHHGTEKR